MREILTLVWQKKLTAGQALNKLQDKFIEDRKKFRKLEKNKEWILYQLEALREKAINTTECEEEIKWVLNHN